MFLRLLGAAALASMLFATGCTDAAKQAVTSTVEKAKRSVEKGDAEPRGGPTVFTIKIDPDKPATRDECYARFTRFYDGRPSVLQINSQPPGSRSETYPALFIHAPAEASKVSELAGQTFAAEIFLSEGKAGPIWHTPDGEIRIDEIKDSQVKGALVGGRMVNAATGDTFDASGEFVANLPE